MSRLNELGISYMLEEEKKKASQGRVKSAFHGQTLAFCSFSKFFVSDSSLDLFDCNFYCTLSESIFNVNIWKWQFQTSVVLFTAVKQGLMFV